MDIFKVFAERRTYRGMYKSDPVPREHLKMIMEAALAAPSGNNKQSASAIAVDDSELLKQIGDILGRETLASAPAAICILTDPAEQFSIQDFSAAVENALLSVTALGYESAWIDGLLLETDDTGVSIGRRVSDLLNVPKHLNTVVFLPVGLPAEEGSRAKKLPFEERAWFNGYRN